MESRHRSRPIGWVSLPGLVDEHYSLSVVWNAKRKLFEASFLELAEEKNTPTAVGCDRMEAVDRAEDALKAFKQMWRLKLAVEKRCELSKFSH